MTAPRRNSDRLSWFKMDAGAFLADTTGLPAAHVGMYARLLTLYWTQGCRLPDNPVRLKRLSGVSTPEDEQTLQEVLEEFFPGNRNERLDIQLEEAAANSRAQSEKAKARHSKAAAERKQEARVTTQASGSSHDDSADF